MRPLWLPARWLLRAQGLEGAPGQKARLVSVRRFHTFDADDLAPPELLDNGFIKATGRISRIGVQIYQTPGGGEHRELRLPEEVFDEASLASFRQMPVTNNHPGDLVTAQDAKRYIVGSVGQDVKQEGNFVTASLMLYDAEAIACAKAGRSQLSCGYSCEVEEVPGEWNGEKYDAVQRNIRGNHVALVDQGRAGPEARLRVDRLDATDAFVLASNSTQTFSPENTMPQSVKIDGLSLEVTDANAATIQSALDRALTAQKQESDKTVTELKAKLDSVTGSKAKLVKVLAHQRAVVAARRDAMQQKKQEMIDCPQCDGAGEMMDAEGMGMKCDFCDGEKKVSALADFGGKPMAKEAAKEGEESAEEEAAEDAAPMEMDDQTEEEVEVATEEEAKAAHKDAKDRADKIAEKNVARLRKLGAQKRDGLDRARAEKAVRPHLGDEAKLDGMLPLDMYKAAIEKLAPGRKLVGAHCDIKEARAKFDTLVALLPSPSDGVHSVIAAPQINLPTRTDSHSARDAMIKRNQDAWKPSAAK